MRKGSNDQEILSMKPIPHLTYMTRQMKRDHKKRSKNNDSKSQNKDSQFRSGERSLGKNQNVTHNNIITANNVIINYSGENGKASKQDETSSLPNTVQF